MIVWPSDLFPAAEVDISLQGRVMTGGLSVGGISQLVKTDHGGLWRITLGGIVLRKKDQVQAWRALEALMDGGATTILLPLCDYRHAPLPAGVSPPDPLPHSDGAYHSDDTGYLSGVMSAELAASAVLGDTELDIDMLVGSNLRGGEHFSIEHATRGHRLYRATTVQTDGTVNTVKIRPPLRDDAAIGATVHFDKPSLVVRLAHPDAMNLSLQMNRFGQVSVTFIEAF